MTKSISILKELRIFFLKKKETFCFWIQICISAKTILMPNLNLKFWPTFKSRNFIMNIYRM